MPTPEKLVMGRIPVAVRVARALESCRTVTGVVAAVSPHAPRTRAILESHAEILDTPGAGYSADLAYALKRLDGPVLVVPADLPLLDGYILESISCKHDADFWTTILVSEGYAARSGLSEGLTVWSGGVLCRYTGVSMVDAAHPEAPSRHVTINDYRLAANMNTIQDWMLLGAAQDSPVHFGL